MQNKDIKLAKIVKLEDGVFDRADDGGCLDFNIPKHHDLIILAGNKGGGYIPYKCLLPHQVYLTDLKKDFIEHNFEVIYVIPVKAKLPFPIAYRDDYSHQRWHKDEKDV